MSIRSTRRDLKFSGGLIESKQNEPPHTNGHTLIFSPNPKKKRKSEKVPPLPLLLPALPPQIPGASEAHTDVHPSPPACVSTLSPLHTRARSNPTPPRRHSAPDSLAPTTHHRRCPVGPAPTRRRVGPHTPPAAAGHMRVVQTPRRARKRERQKKRKEKFFLGALGIKIYSYSSTTFPLRFLSPSPSSSSPLLSSPPLPLLLRAPLIPVSSPSARAAHSLGGGGRGDLPRNSCSPDRARRNPCR